MTDIRSNEKAAAQVVGAIWVIAFERYDPPEAAIDDQIGPWDYLDATAPMAGFPSQDAAQAWLADHHLGPDDYDVNAVFRAIQANGDDALVLYSGQVLAEHQHLLPRPARP